MRFPFQLPDRFWSWIYVAAWASIFPTFVIAVFYL
jgi:hypothetical protein